MLKILVAINLHCRRLSLTSREPMGQIDRAQLHLLYIGEMANLRLNICRQSVYNTAHCWHTLRIYAVKKCAPDEITVLIDGGQAKHANQYTYDHQGGAPFAPRNICERFTGKRSHEAPPWTVAWKRLLSTIRPSSRSIC